MDPNTLYLNPSLFTQILNLEKKCKIFFNNSVADPEPKGLNHFAGIVNETIVHFSFSAKYRYVIVLVCVDRSYWDRYLYNIRYTVSWLRP